MRFDRYLQQLERRLDVPYPARRDLLSELRDHLEALYGEYLADGVAPADAEVQAIRTLAVDETFIGSIDEVHAPRIRAALAHLPTPVSVLIEHVGIGFIAAAVLITVILKEEAMIRFFVEGGFFMIPLNLMGLAILVLAGERIFSLYIKKDHSELNLGRRLLSLRFLGHACALVGVIGTLLGYFQAFRSADRITAKYGGVFPIWEVSSIAITTTIWGLTLALIALISLYVIRSKVARIEQMRIA
jgi:hypothetical protein